MRRDGDGLRAPLPAGFGAIWSCVALDLVGFGIVLPILPLYAERFDATPTVIGLLVASFSLAQLLFAPLWGRVSDRVGRKPVLVLSLAGTAVASLVTGLAGTLWVLFAGRVLDGISGASVSVAQAAVVDLAPPRERARLLGLLGAAFGVGFVAGPAIGGLAALGGPHVPFLVAAALAAVNAAVAARRLPETLPHRQVEVAADHPVWRGRGVAGLVGVAFVALCAFSAFEATFALFGERRLGFDETSIYVVFAAVGLVITLVQVAVVHPVVRRLGDTAALRAGLVLDAAGLLLLAGVRSRPALVPALLALTVGQGLVTPTLVSAVAGRVVATRRGGVLGVQQSAGALARVVGPVAGGVAFQHLGVAAPYVAGAALMLLALVLVTAEPALTAPASASA